MSVRTRLGIRSRLTAAFCVGILTSLWTVGVPGAVSAAGIHVQSSPASPVGVTWAPGAQATLSLQATDTDPPPTEPYPGEPPQTCQGSNPSWSWSAQIISGPSEPMTSMNPTTGPSTSQLTVSEFPGTGSWQVEVTATVTYQMTPCQGTVQRTGTTTVTVTVVAVSISTDAQYVGCGLDQNPLSVQAIPAPSTLTGESFSWSVTAGPGNGTFNPSNAQNTNFIGSQEGQATLGVSMTYESAVASASTTVNVVRIDYLTQDPGYQFMPRLFLDSSQYSISYNDSGGALLSVLISPFQDDDQPYEWGSDYSGYVDQETGNVNLTFSTDGPYLLQINRTDGSSLVELWVGGTGAAIGAAPQATGRAVKIKPPTADLICVSNAAGANDPGPNGGGGFSLRRSGSLARESSNQPWPNRRVRQQRG